MIGMNDSRFQSELNWEGSHFLEAANFYSLKVGQAAFFRRAVFQGPVSFDFARIGGNFEASEAYFKGEVYFNSEVLHNRRNKK
jgi:hypothetical protein